MNVELIKITPTSPLRYFLQGAESEDSSDIAESDITLADITQLREGSIQAKLVISFKNPFRHGEVIRQNLHASRISINSEQCLITFLHSEDPFFFSRGHEGRWSKIAVVLVRSPEERKTTAVFEQYIASANSLSCTSLNGRLFLELADISPAEKRTIMPRAARRLFQDEDIPPLSINVRDASLGDPSLGQCAQVGGITKIVSATLKVPTALLEQN